MADRYPLIVDSSAEAIKELPSGDAILFLDNEKIKVGTGSDLTVYHDASNSYITNAVGALKVATETSGIAVTIGHTTSETTVADNLTVTGNMSIGGNFDVTGTLDFSDSALTNVGDIQLDSITGDGDTNTKITFSGSDVITVTTGGSGRLTIGDGALSPVTTNQIDLGTSSLEFKDAFFDGTVTSDAFAGPLTGAVTGNASTATTLATARTIGGVSFDGSANIAVTLAATATALATGRTIGGTSFDGTANIVPGTATLATTATVSDSTANTNFPVVFHNESNGLLDDTGALRYNPSTGQLLVPNLTVAGTTTTVDTVTMEASNAIIFEGATADNYETTLSIVDPTADHTQYLINQGGYIPVLAAATTTAITSTPAELNIVDGGTSATGTTLADADRLVVNDNGTMVQVALTDLETYMETSLDTLSNVTTVGTIGTGVWQGTAVASGYIAADAITGAKIADDAIDSEHYTDGSIDNAHIADDAIDSEHYAAGSIDNAHIADDAIDSEHYAAGSIDTAHIADDQVTLAKMAGITRGSIIIGNSSGNPAALAIGTNDYVLTSDGTDLAWEAAGGGGASDIDGLSDAKSAGTNFANSLIIGHQTTGTLDAAEFNTAVGFGAMDAITSGDYNATIGYNSLTVNTTGSRNAAMGAFSLSANTIGNYNTGLGYGTLGSNTEGNLNVGVGLNALANNTTATENVSVGAYSSLANITGYSNVAVGHYAFQASTTGNFNTAVGWRSLFNNTTADANTAVGWSALNSNTTGQPNVAVGYGALQANTTAINSVAVGAYALDAQTTAGYNTAIGYNALSAITTGYNCVAVGSTAGALNTAHDLVAIGANCLDANTSGANNTGVGSHALTVNSTGGYNTAIGGGALVANTTAGANVAVGANCMAANTTGVNNTAVGTYALDAAITADQNTAVGYQCLTSNTSGDQNVAMGYLAANSITTAYRGVFIGAGAFGSVTTGVRNTACGYGTGGTAGTAAYANTLVGAEADVSTSAANNQVVLGWACVGSGNATITAGEGTVDSTLSFGGTTWSAPSDLRMKEDIEDAEAGLSFINDLRPVTFKWKKQKDIPEELNSHLADSEKRYKNDTVNHGFIAQEVKEVIDNHPEIKEGFDLWSEDDADGRQRAGASALEIVLVKAVQELSAEVEKLKKEK